MPDAPSERRVGAEEGFGRELRLVDGEQFRAVFADALRHGGKGLLLLVRPNGLDHPRLGLAIARKHVRRAVGRNRIKRQACESFRLSRQWLGGVDLIVLSRPGVAEMERDAIRRELERLWRRAATATQPQGR